MRYTQKKQASLKKLSGKNTLAYFAATSLAKRKMFLMMPTPGPARKPAAERAGPNPGEGEADFGGKDRRP